MNKYNEVKMEKGYYEFKLANILSDKDISINKLTKDTDIDFKVIKRLMTGELVKVDIFVLARLCDYLNYNLQDIIDYKH